jgi:NAD(P)-dependent dehydrogenase (short-subunit alcohol dehydrogenase family)
VRPPTGFGTNYLGHFALTAHLSPQLRRARRARVVTVSSLANRQGAIDFDDLQAERSYVVPAAKDIVVAQRLWDLSERMTDVTFEGSDAGA